MIVEKRFTIGRPPDVVFDFLADLGNWTRVDLAVRKLSPSGRVSLGATGTATFKRPMVTVDTTWEVTRFEPGEVFEVSMVGPGYTIAETVSLAADDAGTSVHDRITAVPTSLVGRILVAMSPRVVRKDLDKRAGRLKQLLEEDAS